MFKKKPKFIPTHPGKFTISLLERVEYTSTQTISEYRHTEVEEWCRDMGLCVPPPQRFPPITVCCGDTIEFRYNLSFDDGRAAMLYKLRFGGTGSMGMTFEATI